MGAVCVWSGCVHVVDAVSCGEDCAYGMWLGLCVHGEDFVYVVRIFLFGKDCV